jgi:phage host-nuclease inhibitor protein Gam
MATSKPTRLKAKAISHPVPNSKSEAAADVRLIGDLAREHTRLATEMNDRLAAVTAEYHDRLEHLRNHITTLQTGVQTWCEANREALTNGGKVKTANLITGEVSWRQRPPSCRITGADAVIDTLDRLGLSRFVRVKKEVNKEAILNEPAAVAGVAGISISSGVEDFVIVPFEVEAEVA